MKFALATALCALALLAAPAQAASPEDTLAQLQGNNQMVFCQGTYALCIKAPCTAIPTLNRLGNYSVDHALCSCEIVKGWSMGPGQCADRAPVTQGILHPRTFMISTYSNRFNAMNGTLKNTLSCPKNTLWAWCYGAPCVQDDRDPKKANCTCPVLTSPMQTLGGNCDTGNCKYIYSAALPRADNIANNAFAAFMQAHNYPHEPPAQACPTP